MKIKLACVLIALSFSIAGCQQSSQGVDTSATVAPEVVNTTDTSSSSGIDNNAGMDSRPTPPPVVNSGPTYAELLAITTLFFDFDRSDLRSDHQQILAAHARYMLENPGVRLRLEGHADERGSREYNVGLGERRAQSVKRNLNLQGVQNSQLDTISYGEEKPLDPGHNEFAWQSNRRVELVYK